MLPEDDDRLVRMNLSTNSFVMIPRQPFLSASDYIFYIRLHIEKENSDYYDSDERTLSLRSINKDLPKLSEIFKKLIDDLQSAFDSFINEFVENDGIYCLLNLLRLCLNRQQSSGTNKTDFSDIKNRSIRNKERHHHLKRALNDEYDCLICLQFAVKRNPKALEKMVSHKTGLSTLASCIVSNLTKSRLIALQLLTKICGQSKGVNKVLEAMSTMRIIFGESVRFKFLVSMVNSGNGSSNGIECNALSLLNELLSKIGNCAEKIRLQCELEEAGLDVNALERTLIGHNIPKSQQIWTEMKRFRNQYIDLNEKLKDNKNSHQEKDELKEEVQTLQKALNKLEADKMTLMNIEKELKEKCEDLEEEVDHLKNKFNVLIPVDKKATQSRISDNGTGDSGQWSDSDMEANGVKHKSKANHKMDEKIELKHNYNYDQNMKNEEEFIYVPAIQPPKDYPQPQERERNTKRNIRQNLKDFNDRQCEDTRWRLRQRCLSNEKALENRKPLVVEVHPKGNGEEYSDSTIGTDRENSELILDWNYSIDSQQNQKDYNVRHETPRALLTSISMNQINSDFEYRKGYNIMSKSSQFLSTNRQNINSFDTQFKPLSNPMKQTLSQSNDCLHSTQSRKKGIRSSLQSYFFSGSSTLKQNKKNFQSIENIGENQKSFPLPKTYKKNFILKGHGNCGLYSGDIKQLVPNNLSDDLKSSPFDNMSALVHQEITAAAHDIGAWI